MGSTQPIDNYEFDSDAEITRILLIEDNDGDSTLAKLSILEDDIGPHHIIRVDNLHDGLALIARGRVDIVLTDLGLPDAQGQEVVSQLHDLAPGLPIVVLSGSTDPEALKRAMAAGAQGFVEKDDLLGPELDQAIRHSLNM